MYYNNAKTTVYNYYPNKLTVLFYGRTRNTVDGLPSDITFIMYEIKKNNDYKITKVYITPQSPCLFASSLHADPHNSRIYLAK